jgi:TatD DNase family protein
VPGVTASIVALPGVDVEACRRIAEQELGAAFRVRPYNEVG